MPAPITFLVLFVMLAASAALCIRIAGTMRRRRARHPLHHGAHATSGSGDAVGWTTSPCNDDASPTSGWTGGGGACGGAGASAGWDAGGSDGGGDGGGGGGD